MDPLTPPPVPVPVEDRIITVPSVDEGACLLFLSGLPVVDPPVVGPPVAGSPVVEDAGRPLYFYYGLNNTNTEADTGGDETRAGILQLDVNPVKLCNKGFSSDEPGIRIMYVNALIKR